MEVHTWNKYNQREIYTEEIIGKNSEKRIEVNTFFIDLEKGYNWVLRQEIWRCIRKNSVLKKYVRVVKICTMRLERSL